MISTTWPARAACTSCCQTCGCASQRGATHVIDYTTEDLKARIRELTERYGTDWVHHWLEEKGVSHEALTESKAA